MLVSFAALLSLLLCVKQPLLIVDGLRLCGSCIKVTFSNKRMSSVLDDVVDEVEPAPNIVSVMAGTKPTLLLSIDVGTSGVRAALFDERGSEVPGAQVRSRRAAAVSDFAELDPDKLVDEVVKTVDELLTYHFHSAASIEFIAISAFWHSLIGIDGDGVHTTPAVYLGRHARNAICKRSASRI